MQEKRFAGKLSQDYQLVKLAYPHYEVLQEKVAEVIKAYVPSSSRERIEVLDIGCGDGITADAILGSRDDIRLTAIDNEPRMVKQARKNLKDWSRARDVTILHADALEYLQNVPEGRFDVVASVFTLHNFLRSYREDVLREIFKALKPAGIFVNADKYAPDGQARSDALLVQLERFFEAFIPLGEYDLLKEWVVHNVADQAPDRVMTESDSVRIMTGIGYSGITVFCRHNMEAVLVASKPIENT